MTSTCHTIKVGTLNVQTLRARLAGVFDLAKQHDINTLCLQDKNQRR